MGVEEEEGDNKERHTHGHSRSSGKTGHPNPVGGVRASGLLCVLGPVWVRDPVRSSASHPRQLTSLPSLPSLEEKTLPFHLFALYDLFSSSSRAAREATGIKGAHRISGFSSSRGGRRSEAGRGARAGGQVVPHSRDSPKGTLPAC